MRSILRKLLAHPLAKNLPLDDPRIIYARRHIIQEKDFVRKIYQEWYSTLASCFQNPSKPILEIGSGAGFLAEHIPNLISSDIRRYPWLSITIDGHQLPFADDALHAIVMNNVFHHLPRINDFFSEATRCVETGGLLVMIEPWVTQWSTFIYNKLHHEVFNIQTKSWKFPSSGPLSGANSALPWIIFERDRRRFEREYPQWKIKKIKLGMPFRYLISGGVSTRTLMPGCSFSFWRRLETLLDPWMHKWAMFAFIELEKKP
jgi:SAM-dependent methyltransferase